MSVLVKRDIRDKWWARHWFGVGLVAILFFSAGIRLYQISGFSGNYDEGAHLMVAWLLSEGYSLYGDVGTNQLPFLYQPTAWLFSVGGPSSVLARLLEVGYALLGIVAVAGIGRLLWRPSVGLVAALFLSLELYYFRGSRIFGGSVAAAAVGGLAVLCALCFWKTGNRKLLFLTGVIFSFSLLIKPLSLFLGLILLGAVIARWVRETGAVTAEGGLRFRSFFWRELLVDCLYLGVGTLALPLLCCILYDATAMVSRMLDCRLATKLDTLRGSVYLARILTDYVRVNLPLFLLATMGILAVIWRRDSSGVWMITWLGLSLALIVVWRSHSHHMVILSFPLALLAAYAVMELDVSKAVGRLRFWHWSSAVVVLLLCYWLGSRILGWQGYFSVAPRGLDRPDDV